MSEKVQFQTNVSIDIALKYNDGKEVTGQYGDQVLYTLTDGRVMYVPPIVKKKIDELRIGRGELFTCGGEWLGLISDTCTSSMRVCQFRHDRKLSNPSPASSNTYLKLVRLPIAARATLKAIVLVLSLSRPELTECGHSLHLSFECVRGAEPRT
jgi:hypothetical protein